MAYRTKLTAPPGEEPETAPTRRGDEWWSPGLAIPSEPRPPSQLRTVLAIVALVALGALLGFGLFTVLNAEQGEDPALEIPIDRD